MAVSGRWRGIVRAAAICRAPSRRPVTSRASWDRLEPPWNRLEPPWCRRGQGTISPAYPCAVAVGLRELRAEVGCRRVHMKLWRHPIRKIRKISQPSRKPWMASSSG